MKWKRKRQEEEEKEEEGGRESWVGRALELHGSKTPLSATGVRHWAGPGGVPVLCHVPFWALRHTYCDHSQADNLRLKALVNEKHNLFHYEILVFIF